ncbi:MAG: zinc-dependent dehydrogenase [Thermodesulfovibrionales bacterium]
MKAARLYGFGDIRVEETAVPRVGPRDALMRTRASGICSGDAMKWYIEKKAPIVLGHEPAGEIVETGSEVASFSVGDRVFAHHHAPCLECRRCRRGDYVQCETWRRTGLVPGGIAEYVLIPATNLEHDTLRLPDEVGFEDATLVEPLACVVKGLRRAGLRRGDTALVMGMGAMGALNLLALKRYGAGRVICADMVPYRLEKARSLGADGVIDASGGGLAGALRELTGGEMADVVVVGPNSASALSQGIECAGRGATVLMFTPAKPGETITVEPNELYFRDISLVTSYSCGPDDTREALELIRQGAVRAAQVVTHRFPIEETAEAYRLTALARESLKCVIVF